MLNALLISLSIAASPTVAVHVDGEGYLRFVNQGRIVYATSANLTVDSGFLGSKGLPLTPAVRIPANAVGIGVDLQGNIVAFNSAGKNPCGQIVLARFSTKPVEDQGFFVSTTRATLGNPGEGLFGVIRATGSPTQSTAATASISIPKLTEVEANDLTLADISTVEGSAEIKQTLLAVPFGAAPKIGIDMPVTTGRILSLIKRAGLDPHVDIQIAPGAVIRRKGQSITEADFVATATKAAQKMLGAEVALTCGDNPGDFKAPLGQIELKADNTQAAGSSIVVKVGIYVDGTLINSRIVTLKPDVTAQIKAGTAVKILMQSSGVSVEVPGTARTSGIVGQTITVVVTETGSVLAAVVVSADKVQVKL